MVGKLVHVAVYQPHEEVRIRRWVLVRLLDSSFLLWRHLIASERSLCLRNMTSPSAPTPLCIRFCQSSLLHRSFALADTTPYLLNLSFHSTVTQLHHGYPTSPRLCVCACVCVRVFSTFRTDIEVLPCFCKKGTYRRRGNSTQR